MDNILSFARSSKSTKKHQNGAVKVLAQAARARPAKENAEIRQIWKLLWLCPNTSSLVRSLLAEFDDGRRWHFQAAFLLEAVLEVQSIYHEQIRVDPNSEGKLREDGVLISLDEVILIIRIFSQGLIAFHTGNCDAAINREMQFRVLATALSLSQLHGVSSLTQEVYQARRTDLTARINETLNGRAIAKEKGNDIHGFGDGELLIRYALDFLAETPGDRDVSITIVKGIVGIFFAVGLAYSYNYPEAFKCLQEFKNLPDKTHRWHKQLHELYRVTLGAISLARYSACAQDPETVKRAALLSQEAAQSLLEKIEKAFRPEFERLKSLSRFQKAATAVKSYPRKLGAEPPADERHAAFGFLYLLHLLSGEFSHLVYFQTVEKLCQDIVLQSAGREEFKMIRFKAIEVLLAIKAQTTPGDLSSDDLFKRSSSSHSRRKDTEVPKETRGEAAASLQRYLRKTEFERLGYSYAIKKVQQHHDDHVRASARSGNLSLTDTEPNRGNGSSMLTQASVPVTVNNMRRAIKEREDSVASNSWSASSQGLVHQGGQYRTGSQQSGSVSLSPQYLQRDTGRSYRGNSTVPQHSSEAEMIDVPQIARSNGSVSPRSRIPPPQETVEWTLPFEQSHTTNVNSFHLNAGDQSMPMVAAPSSAANGMTANGGLEPDHSYGFAPRMAYVENDYPAELGHGRNVAQELGSSRRPISPPEPGLQRRQTDLPEAMRYEEGSVTSEPYRSISRQPSEIRPWPPDHLSSQSSYNSPRPSQHGQSFGLGLSPLSASEDFRRGSRSTTSSSTSSSDVWRETPSRMDVLSVQVAHPRKARLMSKSRNASSVAISPNGEFVAFVFPSEIEVCRTTQTGALTTPETLMVSKKGDGSYIAAALSDRHLVAITSKQVRLCEFSQGQAVSKLVRTQDLPDRSFPRCVAVSRDSAVIAVGMRIQTESRARVIENRASINLFHADLSPMFSVWCRGATKDEFPRNISFYADGRSLLFSNNVTYSVLVKRGTEWNEITLGKVQVKSNGGAQGITSITPLNAWSPRTDSLSSTRSPTDASLSARRQYFVLTSILSSVTDYASSFISPLVRETRSRSASPFKSHFHHSCVSGDGRLVALLESSGRLKLARLVPGSNGIGLQMVKVTHDEARIKSETEADLAGKVGIRSDRDGFFVVMVDRMGTLVEARVTVATTSLQSPLVEVGEGIEENGFSIPELSSF